MYFSLRKVLSKFIGFKKKRILKIYAVVYSFSKVVSSLARKRVVVHLIQTISEIDIQIKILFKKKSTKKMFSSPLRTVSSNIYIYERHSFFCMVCKQRFLTEKNFSRHNSSRKHIRQMQIFRVTSLRTIGRPSHTTAAKLDLLPNDVINELINDLTNQIDQKENFFNEIQLVEDNQLMPSTDLITEPASVQHAEVISVQSAPYIMETAPVFYRPKLIDLGGIPSTYPCLTCFQSLDSQQNFNEHMLKSHFNMSIGVPNLFQNNNLNLLTKSSYKPEN